MYLWFISPVVLGARNTVSLSVRQLQTVFVSHSIQTVTSEPKILIAGDFNDGDESLIIQQIERHGIHNLTKEASALKDIQGTYRYKGQWESIDHILGSPYIFNKVCAASIHAPQFLLEDEKRYGGYRPRRTYNGPRYQPGYSDHLPLVVRFRW